MNLYDSNGWLDAKHIEDVADRNGINFIIMIGKRQVGKTYGVLKLMIDEDKRFLFMRRVKTELDMLEKNVNSPFEKIYPGKIEFKKESEYSAGIYRLDTGEDGETKKTMISTGVTLSSIGNLRGMNGDLYTDLVFDEMIPEEQLFRVRNEGDAFLNAHTTINGNRELEGRPCLRCWLLSNSNNLSSGILSALKVDKEVERMSIRGEESRILKERGIMILLPESQKIIEKRKQLGGLYRAIGGDSQFSRMAYENEFSYNDFSDIKPEPLREYNPYLTIGGITVNLHKNEKRLYVTGAVKQKARYNLAKTESGINSFNRRHTDIKAAYFNGRITFQDMKTKNEFLSLFK